MSEIKFVSGVVRHDEEGNDKTYEDEHVSEYWVKHYIGPNGLCALCDNSGKIKTEKSGYHFCICPNGQVMRWVSAGNKLYPTWAEDDDT